MHKHDVKAVEMQPFQALFQRAADGLTRVVHHATKRQRLGKNVYRVLLARF
jgi:hypothetical protein